MTIEWGSYELFDAGVTEPVARLPRAQARRVFEYCMETKSDRIAMLRQLVGQNGGAMGSSDAEIQSLNDWFRENVQADPALPGMLTAPWYSVAHDVALFLGDTMIERHPNLRWEFFTWGRSDVAFQSHVIMGFSTEAPRNHTNLNIDRSVTTYAHRIVESRGSIPQYGVAEVRGVAVDVDAVAAKFRSADVPTDAFVNWLEIAARRA